MGKVNLQKQGDPAASSNPNPTRDWLAKGLFILLFILLLVAVFFLGFGNPSSEKIELMKWLITTFVGIFGVVIGHYFTGSK